MPNDYYAIAECEHCDEQGVRLNGLGHCDHVDYASAARRGMAMIRQAHEDAKQENK